MNRVTRYKLGYLAALAGIAALCLALLRASDWNVLVALILAAVLIIPGRIQGVLFRDLLRGRYELEMDRPAKALDYLESFRRLIQSQPWRKPALWLSWSVYTPHVEAMTLNNVGVAHLATGSYDAAEHAWRQALALDPEYPIPHVNLAALAYARGTTVTSEEHLAEARRLGFTGRKLDQAIQQAQKLLAKFESTGPQR